MLIQSEPMDVGTLVITPSLKRGRRQEEIKPTKASTLRNQTNFSFRQPIAFPISPRSVHEFPNFGVGEGLHPSRKTLLVTESQCVMHLFTRIFISKSGDGSIDPGTGPRTSPFGLATMNCFRLSRFTPLRNAQRRSRAGCLSETYPHVRFRVVDHVRDDGRDFLQPIRNDGGIAEQFRAMLKRPREDIFSRREYRGVNISPRSTACPPTAHCYRAQTATSLNSISMTSRLKQFYRIS
jgi:hypothetical protein